MYNIQKHKAASSEYFYQKYFPLFSFSLYWTITVFLKPENVDYNLIQTSKTHINII